MFILKKLILKPYHKTPLRTFKNFGHKPEPIPIVTFLWHGFLTCTFIGLGIEWKKIAVFFFGQDHNVEDAPWKCNPQQIPNEKETCQV